MAETTNNGCGTTLGMTAAGSEQTPQHFAQAMCPGSAGDSGSCAAP
jgi:hypothetical protein